MAAPRGSTTVASLIGVLALMSGIGAQAEAHHGFGGRYDKSQPLYVEGTVTTATWNLPHALINIEPSPPTAPPQDLFELDSASYSRLGGREVVERTQPIQATGSGVLTLLLPPPMTSDAQRLPDQPGQGDTVGAIVFRECSTGELRVQLLRLSATERLVRNGVIQREVDGCALPSPSPLPTATPLAASPTPVAATTLEPVEIATRERADDRTFALLLGAAGLAALVGLGAGLMLWRRRPS
jgi:hypothetical protein